VKFVTEARRLYSQKRIDSGVESLGPLENFDSEVIAREPVASTGQHFGDDVF
jgi:hypothetical protein